MHPNAEQETTPRLRTKSPLVHMKSHMKPKSPPPITAQAASEAIAYGQSKTMAFSFLHQKQIDMTLWQLCFQYQALSTSRNKTPSQQIHQSGTTMQRAEKAALQYVMFAPPCVYCSLSMHLGPSTIISMVTFLGSSVHHLLTIPWLFKGQGYIASTEASFFHSQISSL